MKRVTDAQREKTRMTSGIELRLEIATWNHGFQHIDRENNHRCVCMLHFQTQLAFVSFHLSSYSYYSQWDEANILVRPLGSLSSFPIFHITAGNSVAKFSKATSQVPLPLASASLKPSRSVSSRSFYLQLTAGPKTRAPLSAFLTPAPHLQVPKFVLVIDTKLSCLKSQQSFYYLGHMSIWSIGASDQQLTFR